MKIGIIGFGSIGNRHYQNLKKYNFDIKILTKRKDISLKNIVSSWDDFSADADFDIIFVTNETAKHFETIKKCIKLKPKAIFIEKPLSHNIKGLNDLARELKRKKISAWVGYNLQFFKPFIKIKNILNNNLLGKLYYMRLSVGQNLSVWRDRDYRKCYSSQKKGGGGVMLDLVHDINYPAWLIEEKLSPITCVAKKLSDLEVDTEDYVESVLKSESGIMVSIHQDFIRASFRRSLEISGVKASLNWNSDDNIITVCDKSGNKIISDKIKIGRNKMFRDEIDHIIKNVKKNNYFSNIDEAARDVKIINNLKKYAAK